MINNLIRLGKKAGLFKDIFLITGEVEIIIERADGRIEREVKRNTIQTALKQAVANHLADGTVNFGIDALFTTSAVQGGAEDGNDGIVISDAGTAHTMITTLDSGGDGTEVYAKFKGVYTATGAYTVTAFYLTRNLTWVDATEPVDFALQTASKVMANGDVITVYWTVTVS